MFELSCVVVVCVFVLFVLFYVCLPPHVVCWCVVSAVWCRCCCYDYYHVLCVLCVPSMLPPCLLLLL